MSPQSESAGRSWPEPTMLTGSVLLVLSIAALLATKGIILLPFLVAAALTMLIGAVAVIADAVSWKQHVVASAALFAGFAVFFITNLSGLAGLIALFGIVGVAAALSRTALSVSAFGIGCAMLAAIAMFAD